MVDSKSRRLGLSILLAGFAGFGLAQSTVMKRGFNDPETVVKDRMAHLVPKLKLTPAQASKMRSIYLRLAVAERRVIDLREPTIKKRATIGRLSVAADAEVKKVLTGRQYLLLKHGGGR